MATLTQSYLTHLVPQGSRSEIVSRITSVVLRAHYSGPIAHPRHLAEYERIASGAAKRIIAMAENQQQHQIDMQTRIVNAEVGDRKLGMCIGAALFLALVLCAFLAAIYVESQIVPGLFLGTAAFGVVGLFVRGRSNNGDSKKIAKRRVIRLSVPILRPDVRRLSILGGFLAFSAL